MLNITGIQKLSLVDYDSEVSTTIFLAGCNFRCPFCHNFEFVIYNDNELATIDENEVLKYLDSRKNLLTGVVISGGEPTLYKELPEYIRKIKNMGYKVKLDTNGTNPEMVKYLFENKLIDYIAVDIKNSKEKYEQNVGCKVDIKKIEETIFYLMNNDLDYEFRTTLVNEFHDKNSIDSMGKWIKGAKRLFLQKFVMSDNVPNRNLNPVNEKDVLEFKHILESYNINVDLRGY